MSGNPFLRLTRYGDKSFDVIEPNEVPIAPCAGLILGRENVAEKNGPFSLTFCQIVALMLPHRSWFAGFLLVAILFPPLLK